MSKKLGNEDITNLIAKKRGRKSKKEIEEAQKSIVKNEISENIVVNIEETGTNNDLSNSTSCIYEIIGSENENENLRNFKLW